jgi:glycosyltransferase involved in cell wall biosynthesis
MTARFADAIISDAEAIRAYWLANYERDSYFIPYGADVLPILGHNRVTDMGLEPGAYVLAVARLVPENNVDLLIDAIELLHWKIPLVVVGSGTGHSPLESRLRSVTKMEKNLHWLGHVSDQELLDQLWQNCALYVHGHSVGGTNPALLQALGAGAPAIALDTPYNREVLGPAGITYPGSSRILAQRIEETYFDHDRRAIMTDTGRRIVASRYQWRDVLEAYQRVLAGLLTR